MRIRLPPDLSRLVHVHTFGRLLIATDHRNRFMALALVVNDGKGSRGDTDPKLIVGMAGEP